MIGTSRLSSSMIGVVNATTDAGGEQMLDGGDLWPDHAPASWPAAFP